MARHRKPITPVDRKAARAALFTNDKIRSLYERLEEDPRIGPAAPGDGDIVLWASLAISLLLADFHQADKSLPYPRQDSHPPPADPPQSPDFLSNFGWMGLRMLYGSFKDSPLVPHSAWVDRYAELERDMWRLWGGRRIRVHSRSKRIDPEKSVRAALLKGVKISDIPATTGVSRATVYRILKRAD